MRMTVVLPQPEGPTKTTNSPRAISSESGSTTSIGAPRWSAKRLVTVLERDEVLVTSHAAPLRRDSGRRGDGPPGSAGPRLGR